MSWQSGSRVRIDGAIRRSRSPVRFALVVLIGVAVSSCNFGDLGGSAIWRTPAPTEPVKLELEGRMMPLGGRVIGGVDVGNESIVASNVAGLGVRLWRDASRDGKCPSDLDVVVATTTTAVDGSYQFDDLDAGTYCVELTGAVDSPAGSGVISDPVQPSEYEVTTVDIQLP